DAAQGGGARALPQALQQPLAVERIVPDQKRLQVADQRARIVAGRPAGRAEEGMAFQPLIGPQGDKAQIARAGKAACVLAVLRRRNAIPREQGDRDIGDLHAYLPEAISCGARRLSASLREERMSLPLEKRLKVGIQTIHRRTEPATTPWMPATAELRELVELVDRSGFDSLWVGDHISFPVAILDPFQ